MREGYAWETVSRDGLGRTRGWLSEERRTDKEDKTRMWVEGTEGRKTEGSGGRKKGRTIVCSLAREQRRSWVLLLSLTCDLQEQPLVFTEEKRNWGRGSWQKWIQPTKLKWFHTTFLELSSLGFCIENLRLVLVFQDRESYEMSMYRLTF